MESSSCWSASEEIKEVKQKIKWVSLNVGGKKFMTSTDTLTRDPQSFLARLVSTNQDIDSDKVSVLNYFWANY